MPVRVPRSAVKRPASSTRKHGAQFNMPADSIYRRPHVVTSSPILHRQPTLGFIGGQALRRRHNSQTQSSPAEQQQGGSARGLFQRLLDRLTNRRAPVDRIPAHRSSPALASCLTPARATCLTRAEAEGFAHLQATAGIDVPAKTDTDSHWCFPENGIIRHPSRDTFGTAPSGAPLTCPVSTAPSEGLEFIQPIPIPALNDPQALRHHSRWYCHRCGRPNFPHHAVCTRCNSQRCSICRPQMYATGANSDPDRHLSPEEMRRYGGAYGEESVAQQVARSKNTESP
ncbi:hypothetical protein F5X68DRAFT_3395 [Plectosphaerella plurivora]|uniref:RanBP2-type domain-containing protein n=1 Tax=Plectosphaerella plurivora TaxID=936078 RepID=A0A9P8VKK0_9PEZI|nr:hypothetical protein F5X68DRAFT_3395 [Plectosphaerella plurivora]